jgi:hypothetical protein
VRLETRLKLRVPRYDGGCGANASASVEIVAQQQVVLATANVEQDFSNIFSNS